MTSTWGPATGPADLQWPSSLPREEFLQPLSKANVLVEMDAPRFMAEVRTRALWWIPQMGDDILKVNEALKRIAEYRMAARSRHYPKQAFMDVNEAERRMEHRLGVLIREGQERGEYRQQGDGNSAAKIALPELLGITHRGTIGNYRLIGGMTQGDLEEWLEQARAVGDIGRGALLRKLRGVEVKSDRSQWNAGRRRIDFNVMLRSFADDLDSVTAGLEHIDPELLDVETKRECKEAIWSAITKITQEMSRW